jgi:hypothetical protein
MRLVPQRAPAAPAEVVARADLPRGEKVLAFLQSGDTWLLGTRSAFVILGADGVRRVPWEQVENAAWDRDESLLVVSEVGEWGQPRPEHRFAIQEPGRLLELMRERVTASVVLQRRVAVSGRRGFTVIGRRSPTGGPVDWFVEYDEGVDPGDAVVRELAGTALDGARAELI